MDLDEGAVPSDAFAHGAAGGGVGGDGNAERFKGSEYLKFPAAAQGISVVGISSTLTP